jgi:hypothetical protein
MSRIMPDSHVARLARHNAVLERKLIAARATALGYALKVQELKRELRAYKTWRMSSKQRQAA